ncbi:putative phage tail protein [Veillonella sp. CNR 79/14]|uniref:putative phage tail protein n=1 Tax=Veillonella sp. CNR 79/14 TaxID=2490954 RepID=UPI000F8C30C1|nr:putative phage tail protein [Veillonella sp. CNR 79/14]DAT29596.1 MAG TPA: tail protein [Caudoviricetes sp.]
MMFNLLRTYKVDVLRYLPKFLSNDNTFKGAQDSLSEEHEKQRLLIIDICKQLFVESATWGLDDWERVYGLQNKHLPIDQRRNLLLVKMRGAQTITESQLQEIVNLVYPPKNAIVLENTGPNTFKIIVNTIDALDEIRRVVEIYKPAHLSYLLSHAFTGKAPMRISGAVSQIERIYIMPQKSDRTITTNGPISKPVGAIAIRSRLQF